MHGSGAVKSLAALALGVLCGVVGTVLFFTLDPSFDPSETNGAGGGNARISFDEEALATLIAAELPALPGFADARTVSVSVEPEGLIRITVGIGTLSLGIRSTIAIDPDVEDGKLKLIVANASLGGLALPDEVARVIERPLQARLDALADGFSYRLTSITTADHRLTLEIAI